ncbi:MAG: hypothetical protein JSU90_07660 [Nitrospiraceae bacterium]|nr:MAG: hypothetical protein JSU90_07660 [Nitrospiraceae bacterium]
MSDWKDIGTLLSEFGLITDSDLKEGLRLHREKGIRLGEALVELGKITMEDIDWVLSKQLNIPYVIVDDLNVDTELLGKLPRDFLIANRVLPLYESEDQVSVVIEDPFNREAISFIEGQLRKKISLSTGSGATIEAVLKQAFQKVGLPDMVSLVRETMEKIRHTSFYRIDFTMAEQSCSVSVFGAGILRGIQSIKGAFTGEDVFRAFNELDIPFLYEQPLGEGGNFLAVYPLLKDRNVEKLPAVIGACGLAVPGGTAFSDMRVQGLTNLFFRESPLGGYPYIASRRGTYDHENTIYTPDAAPSGFRDWYVHAYIPSLCPSCGGPGCGACRGLGYVFEKMEGIYSSQDIKERMREDRHGKD